MFDFSLGNPNVPAPESVKKAKRENKTLTPKEKEQLSAEEKEYKSKRKMIQEKLIKFATRIPVFMYLTDFREYSLKDVITKLEPRLFKKVTGLNVKDFELLVSLNVFNEALMNDAVYKFRRYEDASLSYTGINKHAGEKVGLYNTAITEEEYKILGGQLVESMQAPAITAADIAEATYLDNIEDDSDNSSNDNRNNRQNKNTSRWNKIQEYLKTHNYIMNANVRELLGVSSATANRILNKRVKTGVLAKCQINGHWAYKLVT